MINRLQNTLKSSGYSVTLPRREIFNQLAKNGPITTSLLSQKCLPQIDRATVYRTIELFERLGIINRIWHGFKSQIELSEIFTPHHHHALCQQCGKNIDIVNPDLEKILTSISKQHNFLALGHTLELFGYCVDCQTRA